MRHYSRFVVITAVIMLLICGQTVRSQATEKFEVGGQFSVLRLSDPSVPTTTGCLVPPCFTAPAGPAEREAGFGGRFGYNVTPSVALEAELNFFPDVVPFRVPQFGDGHLLQGLFGAKVGKRFEKVGVFAKARPGFLKISKGDLQHRADIGCIAIFPPPAGCFEGVNTTHFAVDVGGVVEFYPSKRIVVRFDAGDTIVRFGERRIVAFFNPAGFLAALPVPAETTHNFQASLGVAFRF